MRTTPTTNAGSMADIAFTLLIFFLVSTSMVTDKGKRVQLSPWIPCEDCIVDYTNSDLLLLEVKKEGQLYLEGQPFDIQKLKEETISFLMNQGKKPEYSSSYSDALVYIKTEKNAEYEFYIEVFSNVKKAFTEIRNTAALEKYGKVYEQLTDAEAADIRQKFPLKIAEETVD